MTRNDVVMGLGEIRAVVIQCNKCGTEVHVNLGKTRMYHGKCSGCDASFEGDYSHINSLIEAIYHGKDASGVILAVVISEGTVNEAA